MIIFDLCPPPPKSVPFALSLLGPSCRTLAIPPFLFSTRSSRFADFYTVDRKKPFCAPFPPSRISHVLRPSNREALDLEVYDAWDPPPPRRFPPSGQRRFDRTATRETAASEDTQFSIPLHWRRDQILLNDSSPRRDGREAVLHLLLVFTPSPLSLRFREWGMNTTNTFRKGLFFFYPPSSPLSLTPRYQEQGSLIP